MSLCTPPIYITWFGFFYPHSISTSIHIVRELSFRELSYLALVLFTQHTYCIRYELQLHITVFFVFLQLVLLVEATTPLKKFFKSQLYWLLHERHVVTPHTILKDYQKGACFLHPFHITIDIAKVWWMYVSSLAPSCPCKYKIALRCQYTSMNVALAINLLMYI